MAADQGGRSLIPHAPDTERGRVSQRLAGVRTSVSMAAKYPREEPYALMSARAALCGGYQATGIPTAITLSVPHKMISESPACLDCP